jgi:hypothetical protein
MKWRGRRTSGNIVDRRVGQPGYDALEAARREHEYPAIDEEVLRDELLAGDLSLYNWAPSGVRNFVLDHALQPARDLNRFTRAGLSNTGRNRPRPGPSPAQGDDGALSGYPLHPSLVTSPLAQTLSFERMAELAPAVADELLDETAPAEERRLLFEASEQLDGLYYSGMTPEELDMAVWQKQQMAGWEQSSGRPRYPVRPEAGLPPWKPPWEDTSSDRPRQGGLPPWAKSGQAKSKGLKP